MKVMPRVYECQFKCGFTRSRKYVVTEHEQTCPKAINHLLLDRISQNEDAIALLKKEVAALKTQLANKRTRDQTVLYNFQWNKDLDDMDMTKPDVVKRIWTMIGKDKKNALKYWLDVFFDTTPRFFKTTSNGKVVVKGVLGTIDNRTFGIDGCESIFTYTDFYNAFIPNMCDLIERSFCDYLFYRDIKDPAEKCKKILCLEHYYRPKRDAYDTDAKYREANRNHKLYRTETIAWLKKCMTKKVQDEHDDTASKCV